MQRQRTLKETALAQTDLIYSIWLKQMIHLGFNETSIREHLAAYGRQQLRDIVKPIKKPYSQFTKEELDQKVDEFEEILEQLFETAKLYKDAERRCVI